jgi:16S rRNA (guanine966-N2)-methyltransferase
MHSGTDPAYMPRIIAGLHRSRTLESVSSEITRPYTDRVKESVFNILQGHIEGSGVLDAFAGVGTMGLEAVSRGASHVVLIEQDVRVHSMLTRNIELLGCADMAEAVRGDALSSTPVLRAPRPLHVVFLDPPYAMMRDDRLRTRVLEQAAVLGALLDPGGWLVLRSPLDPRRVDHLVDGLSGPEVRMYQKQHAVLFYTREDSEGEVDA